MDKTVFEEIKKIDENGKEYWSARELGKALEYSEFRKFIPVINKATIACKHSLNKVSDHFVHVAEMIPIAIGTVKEALRKIENYKLSRYACYLIIQNADPNKEVVALGQTYFAISTRRNEMNEQLLEDKKRVVLRDEISTKNKLLISTAKKSGVSNFGNFQDSGYMGLYGGLRQKDIHTKKKLKPKEKILDHMGSEELASNWFRITQTDAKLRRENIIGEQKAGDAHYIVGKTVRNTIKELGGTMPEKLPKAEHVRTSKKRLKSHKEDSIDLQ